MPTAPFLDHLAFLADPRGSVAVGRNVAGVPRAALTNQWHALAVICPLCGAGTDEPCIGDSSTPRSAHLQRHALAIELGAPIVEQGDARVEAREPRVQRTTSREAALMVDCPRCGAAAHAPCL